MSTSPSTHDTHADGPSDQPSQVSVAIAAAIGIVCCALAFTATGSFGTSARIVPRLILTLGGLSAVAVFARAFLAARKEPGKARPEQVGSGVGMQDMLIGYLGPPVYGLLFYLLGFWVASTICLASLLVLLGERRMLVVGAITFTTLLSIYVVFDFAFQIRMPEGLLLDYLAG